MSALAAIVLVYGSAALALGCLLIPAARNRLRYARARLTRQPIRHERVRLTPDELAALAGIIVHWNDPSQREAAE